MPGVTLAQNAEGFEEESLAIFVGYLPEAPWADRLPDAVATRR